ncbi:MAG: histidine phosphatase family protein [Gammaproteobacteria bacterium]|nr:histidine phosphatase family protein [Gammaproteobacteria bacterium]
MAEYGEATIDLLHSVYDRGVDRAVALMRHSAREFEPGRHDLENPLTAQGRKLAHRLGSRLPEGLTLRGYASPPHRCMETTELILAGYASQGGVVTRHRPVEALGVFYVLDQMKMWRSMDAVGGLVAFLQAWFRDEVPLDAMMPPKLAAKLVLRVVAEKLKAPAEKNTGAAADSPRGHLDVCVSHDMTLLLVRDQLLGEKVSAADVDFLDALVAFEQGGSLWMTSHHGAPVKVSADI